MSKFVVDLDSGDLMWLAWAAGVADGRGHEAAGNALTGILTRIQEVDGYASPYVSDWDDTAEGDDPEGDFPVWDGVQEAPVEAQEDRGMDPQFVPPPPAPQYGYEVGAGPPPGAPAIVNP